MSNLIDTPDGQYGTVGAGSLLATKLAIDASAVVGVPSNVQTLVVVVKAVSFVSDITVTGNTTGIEYLGTYRFGGWRVADSSSWVFEVMSAVDDQVTVDFTSGAPGSAWYVYGYAGVGIVTVPDLSIPQIPTNSTGAVTVTVGGDVVLAAPSSGAYYLYALDIIGTSSAAGVTELYNTANSIFKTVLAANEAMTVDLQGFRTTTTVGGFTVASSCEMLLRYATGP